MRIVRQSLDSGDISHHFQPVWSLMDGTLVGFEALSRFGEGIPPDQVFREAIHMRVGRALDMLSTRCALQEARSLPGYLFLNLDPNHLKLQEASVRDTLGPHILRHRHHDAVILEITEAPERDRSRTMDGVDRMRRRGIRLALDDAGTDSSDLDRLDWLHPSFVKLDRSLVQSGLAHGETSLSEWIRASRRLGATLVAEGVEDIEQGDLLRAMSVDWVQGYAFGRPETAEAWSARMPELARAGRLTEALRVFTPRGLEQWGPPSPALTNAELGDLLFENLPFPVLVVDPEGRIASLNACGERTWGVTVSQAVGQSIGRLGLRQSGPVDHPIFERRGPDGSWKPAAIWAVAVESRARVYHVMVATDMAAAD